MRTVLSLAALSAALMAASVGAGCGLSPSATCQRYVVCQQDRDDSVDTSAYEEGGACWATPRTAAACDEQCEAALEAIAKVDDAPSTCR